MQRIAAALRPSRRFAASLPHAGQPPPADDVGLRRIAHIDDSKNAVGEAVEMRRDVGVAPADIPDAMQSKALDRHEADLARFGRPRYVVDPEARRERHAVPVERFGERAGEEILVACDLLRGPNIGGVDDEEQIVMHLEMERPGVRRRRHERNRDRLFGITDVDDREAAAEDMADKSMAAMDHDLHAIAPAALIAMTEEPDVTLRRCLHQVTLPPARCGRKAAPARDREPALSPRAVLPSFRRRVPKAQRARSPARPRTCR